MCLYRDFWGNFREDLKARTAYLSKLEKTFGKGTATVLLGVRRAGKSSLAYLFLQKLISQKTVEPKDSLIVNFEGDPHRTDRQTRGRGGVPAQFSGILGVQGCAARNRGRCDEEQAEDTEGTRRILEMGRVPRSYHF